MPNREISFYSHVAAVDVSEVRFDEDVEEVLVADVSVVLVSEAAICPLIYVCLPKKSYRF